MSGIGKRFIDAGYKDPKPLIKVDGKPIIEHVVNLFPGEQNFIFICNSDHLEKTNMREILERIAPHGKIVEIARHKKGPVFAVSQFFDLLDNNDETIVNYCDFSTYWDYENFLYQTRTCNADGAIAAYKGFHPHMLGTTNYAFMRNDQQWMLEIKEKEPFTNDRMQEYASNGTYYFKNGAIVKKYFQELIDKDINLNGEFYVSLVYNLLKTDGLKVSIYEIEHMLQWGTPNDLEEYQRWSNYFEKLANKPRNTEHQYPGLKLIPLAGKGNRFVQDGYKLPKPLIPVNEKPMVVQAASSLPSMKNNTFVCLDEHLQNYTLKKEISASYPTSKIIGINKVTDGQACTCLLGLEKENLEKPLLIGACDNGVVYDHEQLGQLLSDESVDAIVWSFTKHPSSKQNPQMYGWIKVDAENNVLGVSVKKAISDTPFNDQAIVGTFYFKKAQYFVDAANSLITKNMRVNGEFYVDSCINELIEIGLKVKTFVVDDYICWGTPNDLKTFEYWQSFFHKCTWHPYRLERKWIS